MRIRLLGPMEVRTDDDALCDCGGVKQRAVLAQLALTPNVAVRLDRIAEGVWGEQVPPRYRQNVQVYVSTLRRLLEPGRPAGAPSRIVGHADAYELLAADSEIDVLEFRATVRDGREAYGAGRPQAAADALDAALALWRGSPLADLAALPFAPDVLTLLDTEKAEGELLWLRARLDLGAHEQVVTDATDLVARRPEHEGAWEVLVTALFRTGRQVDALAAARRARDVLMDGYGLDPGTALQQLEERVLRQDPALLGAARPVVRVDRVPVPIAPLVGRDAVTAETLDLVRAGHRLVVLTGPGGTGKTRLAMEVMRQSAALATEWVSLADRAPGTAVDGALVGELNTSLDQLVQLWSEQETLLCLDNLEHIADAGAQVERLLNRCGALQILATSRGPLGVFGEVRLPVAPLEPADAAALYRQRVRNVRPGWHPDEATVQALCDRLDGLPLAIELAAARATTMEPADLLASLPAVDHLHRRDGASERHRSLRATVAWSLDLLTPDTLAQIDSLAVLDGSVDAATARVVADDIELLVDLALVQPVETPAGRRFAMLTTIRAVVRDNSAGAAAAADVLDRVGSLWLAARGWSHAENDWSPMAVERLRADLPVLDQVVRSWLERGRVEAAAELVLARRRGFVMLNRQQTAFDLLTTLAQADPPEPWAGRIAVNAGAAALNCRRIDEATRLLAHVEELVPDDHTARVLGYCYRAALASDQGSGDRGVADTGRAVDCAERSGDDRLRRIAHSAAAWIATGLHDFAAAVHHGEVQLRIARSADEPLELVQAMTELARAELGRGATQRARTLAEDALNRARSTGNDMINAEAQTVLGYALVATGDRAAAAAVLAAALSRIGDGSDSAWTLDVVGTLASIGGLEGVPGAIDLGAQAETRARALGSSAVPNVVRAYLPVAAPAPDPLPLPALVAAAHALERGLNPG